MLSIEGLRLLRGYVRFRADDGFPERFVNYCAVHNFGLWDIRMDSCGVIACINAREYKLLRQASRVSGCDVSIVEKRGLPFLIHRRRERIGIPIGLLLFVMFMALMSGMVWNVSVSGCEKLDDEAVLELLRENGVYVGRRSKSIETSMVEKQLLTSLQDSVFWLALNINGSTAILELREYPPTEKYDGGFGSPCNLVAAFDGVILSMSVKGGKPAVSVGSGVKTGDLLVSGIIQNGDMSTSFYEAKGEIAARHQRSLFIEIPRVREYKRYITSDNAYTIGFFGLNIPLNPGTGEEQDKFATNNTLRIDGVALPVSMKKTLRANVVNQECELTDRQCRLFAVLGFVSTFNREMSNALIIDSDVNLVSVDNGYTVSYTADCIEYVGIQKAILTNEG